MRTHAFNLVELMLAIGVVVVGMVSIMALFPIGANNLRDASVDNYGSQSSEQLLNMFAREITLSNANWQAYIHGASTPRISEDGPSTFSVSDYADFDVTTGTALPFDGSLIRKPVASPHDYSFYKIIRFRDTDDNGSLDAGEDIEFSAIALLWRSQINTGTAIPYSFGTVLNLEVSWPAQLPYAARQKSYFRREVFNPNN